MARVPCVWVRSPPPTRGWSRMPDEPESNDGVSPAHAGMVPDRARPCRVSHGLPRPRGDGPRVISVKPSAGLPRPRGDCRCQSPPPTRGWSLHPIRPIVPRLVSPAHATDGRQGRLAAAIAVSPAHAGMVPASTISVRLLRRSPPPTRGWSHDPHHRRHRPPVSPAHAGMVLQRRHRRYER